jgi:hypothetical protein
MSNAVVIGRRWVTVTPLWWFGTSALRWVPGSLGRSGTAPRRLAFRPSWSSAHSAGPCRRMHEPDGKK